MEKRKIRDELWEILEMAYRCRCLHNSRKGNKLISKIEWLSNELDADVKNDKRIMRIEQSPAGESPAKNSGIDGKNRGSDSS